MASNLSPSDLIPTVILSIPMLEKPVSTEVTRMKDPLLCYVYLGEKIQDVRGVSKEETRIKIQPPTKVASDGSIIMDKSDVYTRSITI